MHKMGPDPALLTHQISLISFSTDLIYSGADTIDPDTHRGVYERLSISRLDGEPLSVKTSATFHLVRKASPQTLTEMERVETVYLIGMPWGESLNKCYDNILLHWYNRLRLDDRPSPMPIPAKLRIDATEQSMREANASENLLIEGFFNLNSTSRRGHGLLCCANLHIWEYNGTSGKTQQH